MATQNVEVTTNLIEAIGATAGRIWHVLGERGELRLAELQKRVSASTTLTHMALGWLAREDKVEISPDGRSFRVRLR